MERFHIYTKIAGDLKMLRITLQCFNIKYFGKENQRYKFTACAFCFIYKGTDLTGNDAIVHKNQVARGIGKYVLLY